jgi:putative protease
MAELLAPAGNPEALDAAINEGADAVYLGLKSFNALFVPRTLPGHSSRRPSKPCINGIKRCLSPSIPCPRKRKTERMYRLLGYLDRIGPDGLIVQDFGVL